MMKRFVLLWIVSVPVLCSASGIRGTKWGMSPEEVIALEKRRGNVKYAFRKSRFPLYFLTYEVKETRDGPKRIQFIFNERRKLINIDYFFLMGTNEFDLALAMKTAEMIIKGKLSRYYIGWRKGNTGVGFYDDEKVKTWKINFWTLDKNLLD